MVGPLDIKPAVDMIRQLACRICAVNTLPLGSLHCPHQALLQLLTPRDVQQPQQRPRVPYSTLHGTTEASDQKHKLMQGAQDEGRR